MNAALNYFDESLFRGWDARDGFFAQKALLSHYNGAAKLHMTWITPEDTEEDRQRKAAFFENWKNWRACLDLAKTKPEKTAFHYLLRKPDDFLGFIYEIPAEILRAYYAGYQAYLWNKIVKMAVDSGIESQIAGIEIPLFSERSVMPSADLQMIERQILHAEKIDRSLIGLTKFRKVRLMPGSRRAL